MKLHLPKQLFTALLAAITLATPATLSLGSSAWGVTLYEGTCGWASFSTDTVTTGTTYTDVDGNVMKYVKTEGATKGTLTLGTDLTLTNLTFDLNYTQTNTNNAVTFIELVGTTKRWGLNLNSGGSVAGMWDGSSRTSDVASSSELQTLDTDSDGALEQVTVTFDRSDGTFLTSSGGAKGDIVTDTGLKSSTATWSGVTLDTNVVSNVYYYAKSNEQGYTISSADHRTNLHYNSIVQNEVATSPVDATYISNATLKIVTGGSEENYKNFNTNAGDIIVGGANAQLYLQTWYDNSITSGNDINLSGHDIYLASSTHGGGALNLGNWSGDTTLGKLVLIENSSINKEADVNDHVVTIGSIEGKAYTLEIKKIDATTVTGIVDIGGVTTTGKSTMTFNGSTTIGNLTISADTNFTFGSTTNIGKTTINSGKTLDITGAFTIGSSVTNNGVMKLHAANNTATTYTMSKDGNLVTGTGTIEIKDNVILNISGHSDMNSVLEDQTVHVTAGAKLHISGGDTLGWSDGAVNTIKLTGEAESLATLEVLDRQTTATNIILEGYSQVIGNGGFNAYKTNGANITASGTNNEIAIKLQPRSSFNLIVNDGGELLVSGQVEDFGANPLGYDNTNTTGVTTVGAVVKSGGGTVEFSHTSNTFSKKYHHQAGITRISGISSFSNGIEMTEGEFEVSGTATVSGKFDAASAKLTVAQNGNLTLGANNGTETHTVGQLISSGKLSINGDLTLGSASATDVVEHKISNLSTTGTVSVEGGVLTLSSEALNFDTGTLVIEQAAGLLLTGTLTGTDEKNITINGSIGVAEDVNLNRSFIVSSGTYSASNDGGGTPTKSGYASSITYTIATGVTKGDTYVDIDNINISDSGEVTYTKEELDRSTFFINENASWGETAGFSDSNATYYVVAESMTFDINWTGDNFALAGKEFILNKNATLSNGNVATQTGWKQMQSLTLLGDAKVSGTKQFGLLGGNHAETLLTLNGNTLTKDGSNTFLLINTTVDTGTINVLNGTLQVGCDKGRQYTDASQAVVSLSGGHVFVSGGNTFKLAGLTGTSATSQLKGSGNLELVGSGEYETSAAVTGNLKITMNMAQDGSQKLHAGSGWLTTTHNNSTEMLKLMQGTLKLHLDEGATLNQSSISRTGGSLVLSGTGNYNLGANTKPDYVSGLTSEDWTGNVIVGTDSATFNWAGIDVNTIGNSLSRVTLKGVCKHLTDSGHTEGQFNEFIDGEYGATVSNNPLQYTPNLILANTTVSGVTKAALDLSNGYSYSVYEFCGDVSGSGDMKWSSSSVTNQLWIFSGDVANWSGQFYAKEGSLQYIRFTDEALTIGTSVGVTNGKLNVQIYNQADVIVNGTISDKLETIDGTGTGSGTLKLTIDNKGYTTSFNRDVVVDSMTTVGNSDATVNATLSAGTVALGTSSSLTLGGGTAEARKQHSISTLTTAAGAGVKLGDYASLELVSTQPNGYAGGNTGNTDSTASLELAISGGTGSVLKLNMDTSAGWQYNNTVKLNALTGETKTVDEVHVSGVLAADVYNGTASTNLGGAKLVMADASKLELRKNDVTVNFGAGDIQLQGATTMALYGDSAITTRTLTNNISGDTLETASDGAAVLTGSVDLKALHVGSSKVTLAGGTDKKLQKLSAALGKMTAIAADTTLQMVDAQKATKVSFSSTDEVNAATMTAKSNNALARLQEDASFTIEDMTLTNTTVTAASVDTKVNLKNVTATNLALAKGAFTTDATAQAQVATGGDESGADYSVTSSVLSGITLDNRQATIAVDLGDLSSAGVKIDKGIYSFAITLDGFHLDDDGTQAGVLFTADSC